MLEAVAPMEPGDMRGCSHAGALDLKSSGRGHDRAAAGTYYVLLKGGKKPYAGVFLEGYYP